MILISHRGNLNGLSVRENEPEYINESLVHDFDAEVDVWYVDGEFWLGHDRPQYQVEENFLENPRLWCHAKSIDTLYKMTSNSLIHCFWHQEDWYTVTSKGFIISYPGNAITSRTICMKPELIDDESASRCYGICSDYVLRYKAKEKHRQLFDNFNSTR